MKTQSDPISLEYASSPDSVAPIWLFKLGAFLGTLSLTGGLGILFLYWITDSGIFIHMGMNMLILGALMSFVAFVFTSVYLFLAYRATIDRRNSIRRGWIGLLIVLLNLSAAAFCVEVGSRLALSPRATFHITNTGSVPIDDCRIFVGGRFSDAGSLSPGSGIISSIRVDSAGPISLRVTRSGTETAYKVSSFATPDSFKNGDGDALPYIIKINDNDAVVTQGDH